MLKKERADFILTRLNELYPETPVPLDHKNNFTLLVAVLLSAQCTDERVNKVTPSLFKLADNPYDMQHIPVEKIYKVVRP
ncbi:MAG: endonuclease III, partial [Porticoccaceae bacterium]|nr:endonuclease III [Porticoccaceae bacterium]